MAHIKILAASLCLASCAAQDGVPLSESNNTAAGDALMSSQAQAAIIPQLMYYRVVEVREGQPAPVFHTARKEGQLAIKDQCVGLENNADFTPLAFAEGTAIWNGTEQSLRIADTTYRLGARVEVGGSQSRGPAIGEFTVAAPSSCKESVWYVAPNSMANM